MTKRNGRPNPVLTTDTALSAKSWREARENGVLFHFPSGLQARVRPVNVDTFIRLGKIPDMLTNVVAKMLNGEQGDVMQTMEGYQKLAEVYNIFCKTCFVHPRVVDEIKDEENEILADDISDIDKQTLFAMLGAPASTLASFRPVTLESLDDLVRQSSNPPSAEPGASDSGVGE